MNSSQNSTPSPEALAILECLRQKPPLAIGEDAPAELKPKSKLSKTAE